MAFERSVTELKLTVPWGYVAAQAWGSPTDKRVLLVNGTGDNAGAFTRLIQLLPTNYYCVAVDLPSHGLSSHLPTGVVHGFWDFVHTLHFILDELQWDKCLYIGHSFGAQIGVMYSVFYPNRLEKIVAVDSLFMQTCTPKQLFGRVKAITDVTMDHVKQKRPTLLTKEALMDVIMNLRAFQINREAAEALFVRAATQVGKKYRLNRDIRTRVILLYFTFEQNLELGKRLSIPVLLIVAKDSWYDWAKEAESLKQIKLQLSDTVSVVTVDGNHDVHNNNPENIVNHITKFFDGDQGSEV